MSPPQISKGRQERVGQSPCVLINRRHHASNLQVFRDVNSTEQPTAPLVCGEPSPCLPEASSEQGRTMSWQDATSFPIPWLIRGG